MLVRELIEYLKTIPGGTPVIVMGYDGKPTSYIMLRPSPDGICFEGIPEPNTEFYKHPNRHRPHQGDGEK